MVATPDTDLRSYLVTRTLTATTPTIFLGPVRPPAPPTIPARALFIQPSGGFAPSPYMDGTNTSYRYMRVQVRVRGDVNAYQDSRDLANAVWSETHTASISGYTRVTCDQSLPLYLGRDDGERHEWAINVMMEKRSA